MPERQQPTNRSVLSFFFGFVRPYAVPYVLGVSLYSAQGFLIAIVMAFMSNQVTKEMLNQNLTGVIYAGLTTLLLVIGVLFAIGIGTYFYCRSIAKADRYLKKSIFRAFVQKNLESHNMSHSGEGIAAMNTDATVSSYLYSNAFNGLLSCLIYIVCPAIFIFLVDYRMGFLSCAIGLAALLIQTRFAKPLGKIGKERLAANAEAVKSVSNILSGAIVLRAFSLQNTMLVSFDKDNENLLKLSFKEAMLLTWQNLFTTVQGWLIISGVFAVGGILVANGLMTLPQLIMIPPMCEQLALGMSSVGTAWSGMQEPLEAGRRVWKLCGGKRPKAASAMDQTPDGNEWNGDYTLSIEHLHFSYQNADKPALQDICLTIPPNQMVAFVGESGSGKSTLLRTILGLYERDGLRMRLGNLNYAKEGLMRWRKHFAYVDQSLKLFDMTIGENIALGREGADAQDRENAAREAYAHEFICGLEKGYQTPAGEKGASLSGGQRQRIAIARALIRKAPVLVFDEATSALDAESERQVMATIQNLRKDHTILLTTHHLQSVEDADLIVVMDKGKIMETGTHRELITHDGIYKRLYMQSST